jgi:ubiquitin C-terminal hydrolase|tara:strand:+ start:2388 stop:3308 length:921 start_codon:yes stop_codon:yes gene_type:complete
MVKLCNLGNTCAINSLLQAINSCHINVNMFQKPEDNTFSKALFELLHLMQIHDDKTIKPSNFLDHLYATFSTLERRQQLDAQEVWTLLSNEVFNNTGYSIDNNKTFTSNIHKNAYEQIAKHNNNKTSLWNDLFQGIILQVLICHNCKNKTYKFEPFYSISLNISDNIITMLKEYFTKEISDEIDCECCRKKSKHFRFIKFYKLPKYLIISLNRYNNLGQKLNFKVDINTNILLGYNILYDNKNKIELNLTSTVNHYGSINSGHYNALDHKNKRIIDDDTIIPLKNEDFYKQNNSIYMLCYKVNFIT